TPRLDEFKLVFVENVREFGERLLHLRFLVFVILVFIVVFFFLRLSDSVGIGFRLLFRFASFLGFFGLLLFGQGRTRLDLVFTAVSGSRRRHGFLRFVGN